MPALITVDLIKEGMELALPVKNKVGQILLPANLILEEKHKRVLQTWGVQSVNIKSDVTEKEENPIDEETLARAKDLLNKRMPWKPGNSYEQEILDLGLAKMIEKGNS